MANPSPPSKTFLAAQVRWAMGRGLPPQAAEDVVVEAWEKASGHYDPARGSFEALMQRIVRNDCAYWWRRQAVESRAAEALRLVDAPEDPGALERASQQQALLLDELTDTERSVFAAWALQKHLGKGQLTSDQVCSSIGLDRVAYENAKRRLKSRLGRLLEQFGWTPQGLLYGDDDVERTG